MGKSNIPERCYQVVKKYFKLLQKLNSKKKDYCKIASKYYLLDGRSQTVQIFKMKSYKK